MDPFEIPADITALDDEALAAALDAALAEAASFDSEPDTLTDEQVGRLEALADFATAARATAADRVAAAEARAERVAAARSTLTPAASEDTPPDEEEDETTDTEAADQATAPAEQALVVQASSPRVSVVSRASAAQSKSPVKVTTPSRVLPALTASADVPGYSTGGKIDDLDDVGQAMLSRMRGLPTTRLGGDKGIQSRHQVAKVDFGVARTDGLVQSNYRDDNELLSAAARDTRLPGGSLTAAGGWCSPSEVLYDLCTISSTEGLLDLPTVQVNRGGLRFTKAPSFSDIYAEAGGWNFTEAQIIAGAVKPCAEITCPPFEEIRLNAVGLCVRAPLLTQATYPELVRTWMEQLLIANRHIVDAWRIAQIVAGSDALDATGDFQTTIDGIAKLEQVANYIRQASRMRFSERLEMLVPYWYRATVRADLARRTGVDLINVDDATITRYFTARGVAIQWLYNFQPLVNTAGVVDTPDEVQVIVYPAGTWVAGTTDVINLDAVYDSTLLAQNEYTAMFAESGEAVVNPCFDSYIVTLPTCASGRTGAADLTTCVLGTQPTP